jgi:hypothetical protein
MKRQRILISVLALGLLLTLVAGLALAQGPVVQGETSVQGAVGTSFTYQGRVLHNGTPIDGTCDFEFSLWDAPSGGSQVGGQAAPGVEVNDGYFSMELDFGASAFTGDARYLEIVVDCGGGGALLDPRVALNPAPYAHSLRPGADVEGSGSYVLSVTNTGTGDGIRAFSSATQYNWAALYGVNDSSGSGVYGSSSSGSGVYGNSTSGIGVSGKSGTASGKIPVALGVGVWGDGDSSVGVYGTSNSASGVVGWSTDGMGVGGVSASGYGVSGTATGSEGVGVYGEATTLDTLTGYVAYGGYFVANGAFDIGVYGESKHSHPYWDGYGGYFKTAAGGGAGVYGEATNSEGSNYGVHGKSNSSSGYGGYFEATEGTYSVGLKARGHDQSFRVGRDISLGGDYGVIAAEEYSSSDLTLLSNDDVHVWLDNNNDDSPAWFAIYDPGQSLVDPIWWVDENGSTGAVGTKGAVVDTQGYDTRKLYAMESPEVWFEDFGTGTLVNGATTVSIEPIFAETVNLEEYHVFLTPLGDCNGLYVATKTPTSFEVRELGGGTSNISFDYRIVAHRLGYEDVRLEEVE